MADGVGRIRERRAATRASAKGFAAGLALVCLLGGGTWIFFVKGLHLLPGDMCDGTLERGTVTRVLPQARAADAGSRVQGAGPDLAFYCHVNTSEGSYLDGRAQVLPVSREKWLKSSRGSGSGDRVAHVSADGGIEAVAKLASRSARVYVPCEPPSVPSYNASAEYGVVTEFSVSDDSRVTGAELRQILTDVAYRMSRHTYELAECGKGRDLPAELPRYEESP
ncbi:hypothetical protein [Streptomyces sp. CAI-85]|uniref:hypothetical protein n=1 Tax=Streptomyces sp. CAI-85 TaxID=1472662 RepID=UPI001587909C|nr:hypothetical protein [Streptomyces sp. CAI-85]NUV59106.1 hypothetical protein [Streptomyces sp. CAI-85]